LRQIAVRLLVVPKSMPMIMSQAPALPIASVSQMPAPPYNRELRIGRRSWPLRAQDGLRQLTLK